MDTKTIPSRVVSLFTLYRYSHVAISFDKKCDVIYSFNFRYFTAYKTTNLFVNLRQFSSVIYNLLADFVLLPI